MAKAESVKCIDNSGIVATKPKESDIMKVATIEALSRHKLRRISKKIIELCCDISQLCHDMPQLCHDKEQGKWQQQNVVTKERA